MHIHQSSEGVVVQAPAKLNLFFEVLGKRTDGYHEIETLMVPISWYDTILFKEDPSGQIELKCKQIFYSGKRDDSALTVVPQGQDNLVVRAVQLFRQEAGLGQGARIELIKRIPAAAGLGGGSSDAAGALMAANQAWKVYWPPSALLSLAARLGSDVSFFLAGGPAICRGRGEQIEPIPFAGRLHFVVVYPWVGLSTAEVYRHCQTPVRPQSVGPLRTAYEQGGLARIGRLLWNRLQTTAETLCPWVRRVREHLAREDVLGHQLTGSGTAYFGLCRHARHARRVARRLHATGLGTVVAVHGCR